MNYFYSFFFLFLSFLILIKPFIKDVIIRWILESKDLKNIGFITILIGVICIYFGTNEEYWYETLWMIITFSLGIVLIIRGLLTLFFLEAIKKFISFYSKHYFKISIPISLIMLYLSFFIVITDYVGPQKDIEICKSDDIVNLICGFKNPEDIVVTPDNEYMFISEMGGVGPYVEIEPGYFALLHMKNNSKIVPNISIEENIWGESQCKRTLEDKYGPHGIDLVQRDDGKFQIGVISHYPKESVEMFELKKVNNSWELFWRGCINVPEEYYFNDISLKSDGSFYATHMYKRGITMNEWLVTSILKKNSGYLVEWNKSNFNVVPKTEGSGPNGISLDQKNNLIYISYNQGDKLTAFDLSNNEEMYSTFIEAPDNPYIKDNSIWITSLNMQPNDAGDCAEKIACSLPFSIYELEKSSLKTLDTYSFSKTVFGLPTVAVPFNDKIYLGSFHSDRIGVLEKN